MTAPAIVGLDLSLTSTGVARPDGTTTTAGTKSDGNKGIPGVERLETLYNRIVEAIDTTAEAIDLIVIEDAVRNSFSVLSTGALHGHLRPRLAQLAPLAYLPPKSLKLFATGDGNANKAAMSLALYIRFGIECSQEDEVDARWLLEAGRHHLGHPDAVPLPKAQTVALKKGTWPE